LSNLSLGQRIRAARQKSGKTLKSVGDHVGKTHAAISQIESGATKPDRPMLIALAQLLNDDFGEEWLREYLNQNGGQQNNVDVGDLSVEDFISLKFGIGEPGKLSKRRKDELIALAKILDKALEEEPFEDE
jgi:transcriptional regulator with XRE-family HTH domain